MSGRGRRAALGVLAVVVVGVGGCSGFWPLEYRPGTVHRDPEGVYAIVLPEDWALDPNHPYGLPPDDEQDFPSRDVAFREQSVLDDPDGKPESAPSIEIDVDSWGGTLQEAVERARGTFSSVADWPQTVDEPVVLPDGSPAHLFGGVFQHSTITRELYVVNGNTLINVKVRESAEVWDQYGGLFDAAMRSLTTPVDAPAPTGAEMSGHLAQPGVPFRDDKGSFTILPPAGWRIAVSPAEGDRDRWVRFEEIDGATSPATTPSVWIGVSATADPAEPELTLPAQVEAERRFPGVGIGREYTRDQPVALADGTPAHLFAGTEGNAQVMVLLVVAHGEFYKVEATVATPQDWERTQDVIEASLLGFAVS